MSADVDTVYLSGGSKDEKDKKYHSYFMYSPDSGVLRQLH
jgi:hypothetical protein